MLWFKEYIPILMLGLVETVLMAAVSFLLGLVVGIGWTLLCGSKNKLTRVSALLLNNLIRGLPELLVLFAIYFGGEFVLASIFKQSKEISIFAAGCLALGLIVGSYVSKLFYGVLLSLPKGDNDVAMSLGLSSFKIFCLILLPQMFRQALPGLGSLWLLVLKDTALISLIGGSDLMSRTQILVQNTQQPFNFYGVLALIYLGLTIVSEFGIKQVERKWLKN